MHQASSRSSSPAPQVPALTIRFLVRDGDPNDQSIQIILGSDVLRSHNADVLFSQDKIIMVDDERNRISIPLVRPENDSVFKSLRTASDARPETSEHDQNGHVGVIGQPTRQTTSAPASARVSVIDGARQPEMQENTKPVGPEPTDFPPPGAGVWGSWRRDLKADPNASKATRGRAMKVLRPTKSSSRVNSAAPGSVIPEPEQGTRTNPAGGASAFGWLNPPK